MTPGEVDAVERLAPGSALAPGIALIRGDALEVLRALPDACVHAVVTDPPYGGVEYEEADHDKLRAGRGGVWRIPPTLDGVARSPVPRFTVISRAERERLAAFFTTVAEQLTRVLVPGGHLMVASNPLLATWTFPAFEEGGLEYRGSVIRLVQTLRGGDRPKNAHHEFPDVTVMPRSGWEPWGLFRRPFRGTVADCLREWGTGGLRRTSEEEPFRDVVRSGPTPRREKRIAPHPSLKPQRLLRALVRASLPLGRGIVLDPFAGAGSTLAAAAALGHAAVGIERDTAYAELAAQAFPALRDLDV